MSLKHLFKSRDQLNILTFPTHERYQQGLALTGHTFWLYRGEHIKDWERKYGLLPSNHILLPPKSIPSDIKFDLVLSQNKFGQFAIAKRLSESLNIPMISLEHTLPLPQWDQNTKHQLRQMVGHINVFISQHSLYEWGFDDAPNTQVIHHMVDTDRFIPHNIQREKRFLSVVNDWINRDHCCGFGIWKNVVDKEKLPIMVLGDTPGLSKPAPSLEALATAYAGSAFFLNTSTVSPIPTALLEAMSAGCICVSTATCMIPEIIKDGYNGFLSNDIDVLAKRCREVLNNPEQFAYIGENARKTILEHFNKESFISKWNETFRSVV